MNWFDDAACRTHDPELFFPIGTTGPAIAQLEEAKAVCAGCAVRCLCLEWAVLAGIDHGVWGGLSEDERRSLKRRQQRRRRLADDRRSESSTPGTTVTRPSVTA